MAIDRETLAAQILCAHIANNEAVDFARCFQTADIFLNYAAKQRKEREPAKVDHDCDKYACNHWSHSFPEPPKPAPKREARKPREWVIDICSRDNDGHFEAWLPEDSDSEHIGNVRVREVLPDEVGK